MSKTLKLEARKFDNEKVLWQRNGRNLRVLALNPIPNCLVITPTTVKASKIKSKANVVAAQIVSSRAKKVVDWFGNIFGYH